MSLPKISAAGRRHALLVMRARRLARPRNAVEPVATIACIVCEAGRELYALPLARVARVTPCVRIAPVPTINRALVGIAGSAGVFYHVYDLARLVGASDVLEAGSHLVMLRGAPPIALRVHVALGVADLVELSLTETAQMQANHPAVTGFTRPLQADLYGGRTISLINPEKLAPGSAPAREKGDQSVHQ
jgi:chemotaxis signal transduction protein